MNLGFIRQVARDTDHENERCGRGWHHEYPPAFSYAPHAGLLPTALSVLLLNALVLPISATSLIHYPMWVVHSGLTDLESLSKAAHRHKGQPEVRIDQRMQIAEPLSDVHKADELGSSYFH